MGSGIQVNRSRVAEIAKAAMVFEWEWTPSGIESFLAQAGPGIRVSGADDRVDHIVVTVAQADDLDEGDCWPAVAIALFEASAALWGLWHAPNGSRIAGLKGESWALPQVVVGVTAAERSVELWLVNPAEQSRLADLEQRATAEYLSSAEGAAMLAAITTLALIDLNAWAQSDVDRVFDAVGWGREEDGETGTVRGDFGTTSLRAFRVSDHQRPYGYGEFESIWLMARLPDEILDLAYTAVLAECVRILGAPSFVGGPNAFATWRRSTTTLKLSRGARLGTGLLEVDLYPTEAKENEDYTTAKWDEYWEPSEYWRIRPDDTLSRADIAGMWFPPDPKATDWESFDRNVLRLFTSLAADLPVLDPLATSVIWVIIPADEQEFVAQGWFEPTRSRVETHAGTDIVFRDYPPGIAGAEQIAAITCAAARTAAETPDGLRYYAFANIGRQRLVDFRLGLADSGDR